MFDAVTRGAQWLGKKGCVRRARTWPLLFLAVFPSFAFANPLPSAFFQQHCTAGTLLHSLGADSSGYHLYREPPEGVQSSEASFEFWRDGRMEWSASAFRSCSNGVSTCAAYIPYQVNGVAFDPLEVEITNFSYNEESYFWVFSQLYAKTTTLWLKTYVSPEVSLVNAGAEGGYEPVGREISLPDVFAEVDCP